MSYTFDRNDISGWKNSLQEQGFAVVRGVVDEKTCAARVEAMRGTLKTLSKKKLTDAEASWKQSNNYPFLLHGGMCQYVGHAPFQWESRADLRPIFADYWGTEELKSSFDGFCYMDGRRQYEPRAITSFLHTDQSPHKQGVWSIQGFLNLALSGGEAGGFVAVPKSHLIHRSYFETRKMLASMKPDNHWYKFTDEEKKDPLFQGAIIVDAKPGDVVLWDSRTFHCNTVPTQPTMRAVAYICMLPAAHIAAHIQKKREEAWQEKRCTAHHPGEGFKTFQKLPRFGKLEYNDVLAVQNVALTKEMQSLV